MSNLLEVEEGGVVRSDPGVRRRGVPPPPLEAEEGAEPAGRLQGSAPAGVLTAERGLRAQWGGTGGRSPEPVSHPSCLSPLKGVWGVSSPGDKRKSPDSHCHTISPGKLNGDLAPGWGLVTRWCLPSPSKMPVPRREARAQQEPHG